MKCVIMTQLGVERRFSFERQSAPSCGDSAAEPLPPREPTRADRTASDRQFLPFRFQGRYWSAGRQRTAEHTPLPGVRG